MGRSWYMRLVVLLGVCGLAVYLCYPTYYYFTQATEEERDSHDKFCAALPSWMTCTKLNLGLDLQGGVHLVMGVRVDKALEHRLDRVGDALRENLKEKKLSVGTIERRRDSAELRVGLAADSDRGQIESAIHKDFPIVDI